MPTSAQTLLRRLHACPEISAAANRKAGSSLRPDELAALVRPRSAPWTVPDIPILDECEELLGSMPSSSTTSYETNGGAVERARETIGAQNLGGGIVTIQMLVEQVAGQDTQTLLFEAAAENRAWTYGHIMVDEAQELSPMAWRALLRRCSSRSFMVVGDLDRRRGSKRPPTWKKTLGSATRAPAAGCTLTVSCRTPATLMTLAEGIVARAGVPILYPVIAMRGVEDCCHIAHAGASKDTPASSSKKNSPLWHAVAQAQGESEERLGREMRTSRGRIAPIAGKGHACAWGADVDGETALSGRVYLLPVIISEGLGFNPVTLVEPAEVLGDGVGDFFIALTRAIHGVHIVHCAPLPADMGEWQERPHPDTLCPFPLSSAVVGA